MPRIQSTRQPFRVLVVCHGNICRSPLAGALVAAGGLPVRSRGFGPSGKRAAKKVREYAARQGLSLDAHRSEEVTPDDLAWADVILYMDGGNLRRLREVGAAVAKCRCLGEFVGLQKIDDPNFVPRGPRTEAILNQIREAVRGFLAQKETAHG